MSHDIEEQYAVYNENFQTAIKSHVCSACGITIPKGGRYCRVTWVYDGSAGGVKRCLACQYTHEHLRGLNQDMWPDEQLDCGESYEEHWGETPPEIAALAFWRYGDQLPADEECAAKNGVNMYPPIWRSSNEYMRGAARCAPGVWGFAATEVCS